MPVWAPNGLEIIYTSTRAGAWNLFQQSIDVSGAPKQLTTTGNEAVPNSFSADGKILIFQELSSDRSGSVAFVDGGDAEPEVFQQLTTDSIRDYGWGRYWDDWAWWSPNSRKLVVKKGDYRNVPKYPIVDYLGPTDDVQWSLSDSDPWPPSELFVVDILRKKLVA